MSSEPFPIPPKALEAAVNSLELDLATTVMRAEPNLDFYAISARAIERCLTAWEATVENQIGSGVHWPKGKPYRRVATPWEPVDV